MKNLQKVLITICFVLFLFLACTKQQTDNSIKSAFSQEKEASSEKTKTKDLAQALLAEANQSDFETLEVLAADIEKSGTLDVAISYLEAQSTETDAPPSLQIALSVLYGRKGLKTKEYAALLAAETAAKQPGINFNIALIYGRKKLLAGSPDADSFMVGTLQLTTNPSGATVIIDGIPSGTTPFRSDTVKAGVRKLRIKLEGHTTLEMEPFSLGVGQTVSRSVDIVPVPLEIFGNKMIYLIGNSFVMGNAQFGPIHTATVSDFYLGSTEVEINLFLKIVNWALTKKYISIVGNKMTISENTKPIMVEIRTPYQYDTSTAQITIKEKGKCPISALTWYGAIAFCNYLSLYENLEPCYNLKTLEWNRQANGYRLPTEAEWEFAARHRGKAIRYPWGDSSPMINGQPIANIYDKTSYSVRKDESYKPTVPIFNEYDDGFDWYTPVDHFPANELGFRDLGGNVQEWVYDYYAPYPENPEKDYSGPKIGTERVIRDIVPWNDYNGTGLEVGFRTWQNPDEYTEAWSDTHMAGLRVARNK